MSSKKDKADREYEGRQSGLSTIEPPPQNKAVMQGWLKKKSPKTVLGMNMWQKRYFFLEQNRLLYFKNKPADKTTKHKDAALSCLGALNIDLIASVEKIKRKPMHFNIYLHESGRVFELWADSNLNVTFWCDALARVGIAVTSSIDGGVGPGNTSPRNSIKKRDSRDQGTSTIKGEKFWKAKNYNARRRAITVGSSFRATTPPAAAVNTQKSEKTTLFILQAIKKSVAFEKLDLDLQKQVVDKMWIMKITKGTSIIKAEERGDLFYVVETGTVDVLQRKTDLDEKEEKVDAKPPGSCFGELAIMYNAVSTSSYVCTSDATLWVVDRNSYRNVVKVMTEKKLKMYEDFLMKSKIIGALPSDTIGRVAEALEEKQFIDGAKIVVQGEEGEVFYIIRSGDAIIQVDGREIGKYTMGDSFGMAKAKEKTATVIAKGTVTTLCLDKVSFGLLLAPLEKFLTKEQEWYNTVSAAEMHKMRHAEEEKQKATSAASQALLAAVNAQNAAATAAAVAAAAAATASGAAAASPTAASAASSATPAAGTSDSASAAAGSASTSATAAPATASGSATAATDATGVSTTGHIISNGVELSAPPKRKLDINELKVIGTLGKGTFGHVQLVEDKDGSTYALKMMAKSHIVKHNQQDHIVSERRVMEGLDHPFIIKMYQTMKDNNFVYLLLEVNLGGELFSVLRSRGKFDEPTARFYAAGVVLAFEYMHDLNIVYRDLKPENLLLDEVGYLKITDFGSAKKIKNRTWTFCGTPDYLAPEIISSTGHGKGVDWWTLGVLIYEMLAGYSPFCAEEVAKIYDRILDGDLQFPPHFSPEAKSIVGSLLELKPTKRLGVLNGGAQLIKQHPWFKGFDWEKFIGKQLKAPIPTNIKNKYDLSNFDDYGPADQLEEYDPRDYPGVDPEWDKEF